MTTHAPPPDTIYPLLADASLTWLPLIGLEGEQVLACIDGRHDTCVVGAPGGNIGEFVLMLAAWEMVADLQLDADQVHDVLGRYVERFGRFYLHTDRHALHRLTGALAEELGRDLSEADALSLIQAPPKALRDRLAELLLDPTHVGCGHLAAMMGRPAAWGVRPELLRHALRAYFALLWSDDEVDYVVLEGDHTEEAMVTIDVEGDLSDQTTIPSVCPREPGAPRLFVHHRAARRYLLTRSVEFLAALLEQEDIGSVDVDVYRESVFALADVQLEATAEALMPDLPRYEVKIRGGSVVVER